VSGTEAPIFSPGAVDEIFAFSGGYPRLINIICDHALLSGYVQEMDTIHANTIRECREELLISRTSSKYPVHDQGITSPEAPAGDPGMPEQDWGFSDQRERFFGRDTNGVPLERNPEPVKRRKMSTFIVVVLVAAIGAIAGYVYFQDETNTIKPRKFSIITPKEVPRPMKTAPLDDKPIITPSIPERSEITDNVKENTVKDGRFSTVRPPEPESAKKTAPTKSEPLDALPLPRLEATPHSPAPLEKTGVPVVSAPGSGTKETVKAPTPTEGKTSATLSPDPRKKTLVAALVPDKTSGRTSVSASTPAKPPALPKISKNVRQDYGKRVEKPAPKPVEIPKEPVGKDPAAAKKPSLGATSSAGSSVFSQKPATGALASSSVKPPEPTVAVNEAPKVLHQMVTQEKERSAPTLPEKKSAPAQNDGRAVSLTGPAGEPETVAPPTVSPSDLQGRLKTFLRAYCRTYEGKNLDMFGAFFSPDALEQGRPFKSWASRYRQNFDRIDSMIYNIELERYAVRDETGEVRIEGTFQVRAKLRGSEKWRKSSGGISMVLEPRKDSFRVKELNY